MVYRLYLTIDLHIHIVRLIDRIDLFLNSCEVLTLLVVDIVTEKQVIDMELEAHEANVKPIRSRGYNLLGCSI